MAGLLLLVLRAASRRQATQSTAPCAVNHYRGGGPVASPRRRPALARLMGQEARTAPGGREGRHAAVVAPVVDEEDVATRVRRHVGVGAVQHVAVEQQRSEERRVGKEGRSRWAPEQ